MRLLKVIGLVSLLILLCSCGGGDGGASSAKLPALMGGSVQGNPLSLTGDITTIEGKAYISGSTDGIGSAARFSGPTGITTDGKSLYVTDIYNKTIRKIVISTRHVTTLAGTAGTMGSADGVGSAASFDNPLGITTDGINLYVTDDVGTVRKIAIATGEVTTLAGTAGTMGSADGVGPAATFKNPFGITTDGINLYVADSGNSTIRKILIATGEVTTLAGTAGITGSADGVGPAASFFFPNSITTDGTNLYVTDSIETIRKIVISTGEVTTLAGTAHIIGSTDGTGPAASFDNPAGITTDGANLYVTDGATSFTPKIRQVVIATGVVTTVPKTAGTFSVRPFGTTTDGKALYVADRYADTIRKID